MKEPSTLSCKRNAYLALVGFLMDSEQQTWDPDLKQVVNKMERIQRKAVRFIPGDYRSSTPGNLRNLQVKHDLPPIQQRQENRSDAFPSFNTKTNGQRFFSFQAATVWNNQTVRYCTSISSFKSTLKTQLCSK